MSWNRQNKSLADSLTRHMLRLCIYVYIFLSFFLILFYSPTLKPDLKKLNEMKARLPARAPPTKGGDGCRNLSQAAEGSVGGSPSTTNVWFRWRHSAGGKGTIARPRSGKGTRTGTLEGKDVRGSRASSSDKLGEELSPRSQRIRDSSRH